MKIKKTKIHHYLWGLLAISALIRGFLAGFLEFGNDEVYYWTYALYPDWSHFDHPPMIGWIIQIFSLNLLFTSEFFLRLSSVVFMTINTYLIYLIGKEIKDNQTGFYAALLYTASIYAFVMTGIFILPDTPLSICMFLAVLQFIRYFQKEKIKNLLLGGLFAGLAMLSKYSGVFIWIGVGLYVICYSRKEFKNPYLYLSVLISAICMLPVLIWNINNDFVSFAFHGDRVSLFGKFHIKYFLEEVLGEFGYNNPVNFILIIIAVVALFKGKKYIADMPKHFLLLFCLPFIGLFWYFSLIKHILPHWTAPILTFLLIFVAAYLADKYPLRDGNMIVPKSIVGALVVMILTIVIGSVEIKTGFIPLNFTDKSKTVPYYGETDFTLNIYGWRCLKPEFQKIRKDKIEKGEMKESDAMICLKWFPMANIDYYVAYPLEIKMLGFGDLSNIHKYAWINKERGGLKVGENYWFLTESSDYYEPVRYLNDWFDEIVPADTITVERCGKPAKYGFVYMLKDLKKVPKTGFEKD